MTDSTTLTPAEVARAVFDSVIRKDPDGIVALGAPDYVDDFVAIGEIRGRAAVRDYFAELFAALSDFQMSVERIVADESTAVVQWRARGVFDSGPYQGMLPTGRRIEIRGVDVMEIADGLIQHNTIYYDGLGIARQIGMLPAQGSAADRALIAAFNAKTRLLRRRR